MVLSAVERKPGRFVLLLLLLLRAALWKQTAGISLSLCSGSTAKHGQHETQTWHTNRHPGTYMARRNIKGLPARFIQTVKAQGNPRRRDLPLYFSLISTSSHTLLMSVFLPPFFSSVSAAPQYPPLHPSFCSPPVSTLIF